MALARAVAAAWPLALFVASPLQDSAAAAGAGLADHPIAGASLRYLDGAGWSASASVPRCAGQPLSCDQVVITIPATVPGDLITDLYAAGVIGNPLYELNFLNSSIWDDHVWTYRTTLPASAPGSLLVFEGVKMGARVSVNGDVLGEVRDQFVRYTFDLGTRAAENDNLLEVVFDKGIRCDGRWMACTGGWDWAPYTSTSQEHARTFTKGIWKSVYVVDVGPAAISHFVPHVFYLGDYPTQPLEDGDHGGFEVRARVHFVAPAPASGTVEVRGAWGEGSTMSVELPAGNSSAELVVRAPADKIRLWWPSGVGSQPLFNITATFTPHGSLVGAAGVSATRTIGFRYAVLATGNDTDPEYRRQAQGAEGSDSHGMAFRVNGAVVWTRGANVIPMEELEGWLDADAHAAMVRSAARANMNMLRVWGGGMFLPDRFYDECDRLGVLVYHDMQYAQDGHSPANTADQDAELRHSVRRLSHHPSIVIWDGCNECTVRMQDNHTSIYATFVMTVVAQEDASRVVWPSCPAQGWRTGTHKLSQHPNGNAVATYDEVARQIEVHGPYFHGTGFPAVDGSPKFEVIDVQIPLPLAPTATGLGLPNVYTSEFGASVMSSFESMAPTLDAKHWALHAGQPPNGCSEAGNHCDRGGNVMAQRNYPCDNYIFAYFGPQDLNQTGERSFKRQLWQCMIAQALKMKQTIELERSQNAFGLLVWQLNEIWPTGGWGSLEYGNGRFPGQVIGGRWKPLHHWYRDSLFADVMVACGAGGQCYMKNDAPRPFAGTLVLQTTRFEDGVVTEVLSRQVRLPVGPGVSEWFQSEAVAAIDGATHILEAVVTDPAGAVLSRNVIPFAVLKDMRLRSARVHVDPARDPDSPGIFIADLRCEAVAVYVTLTTAAHGAFEENAFLLRPPGRRVRFVRSDLSPKSLDADWSAFAASLRVEDASGYRDDTDAYEGDGRAPPRAFTV